MRNDPLGRSHSRVLSGLPEPQRVRGVIAALFHSSCYNGANEGTMNYEERF